MNDLIRRLSEIRSRYNCFDEAERPYYHALSEAIDVLSGGANGDTISRQAAVDALHDEIVSRRICEDTNDDGALDEFDTEAILRRLPSTQPEIIHCEHCKYGVHSGRGDTYLCTVSPEELGEHKWYFYCGYAERRVNNDTTRSD